MFAGINLQISSWLGMRHILSQFVTAAFGASLLSACSIVPHAHGEPPPKAAPAPVVAAPAAPVPTPAPARPRRPPREVHETKEPEKLAAIDPKSLIGLAPAAVEKILGAPSTVVKSDPSLVWTYAAPGCSFQIVFYPDLKTENYHALKYTAGPDADAACIRNILTVRANGPS